jgi:outer membrane murein-binding lipoprotein Lpp
VGTLVLAGCASVPQADYQEAVDRIDELESELLSVEQELADSRQTAREAAREAAIAKADAESARSDLEVALTQLGTLREERQELLEQIATVERALQSQDGASSDQDREGISRAVLEEAISGGRGFLTTDVLGLRDQPGLAARYGSDAPGISADLYFGAPRLFDSRLSYGETALFLTITDPASRAPQLSLHAQYGSNEAPLYLQSVSISIAGNDPVDPIDPLVLTGEPDRLTDGERLLETIVVPVDASIADRLTSMVSSSRLTVTFIGNGRRYAYQPSVIERAALSNMLFAYFDIARGGR